MSENKSFIVYQDLELQPTFFKTESDIWSGCPISKVDIDFCPKSYDRKLPNDDDGATENLISTTWKSKKEDCPRVYNMAKFRMSEVTECQANEKPYVLRIGITDYRDLIGTHYSKGSITLVDQGIQDTHGKDPFIYMGNAIGVGAITVTKDNFIILMKRAGWTAEAAGMIDRPGGHPEPHLAAEAMNSDFDGEEEDSDVIIIPEADDPDLKNAFDGLKPQFVLREIFASAQNELRDEINIPIELQAEPQLLGKMRALQHGGRCGLDFLIKVDLTKEEVEQRYKTGQQDEADESTNLVAIEVEEVKNWKFEDENIVERMTPFCVSGLRLYHLLLNKDDE